MWKGYEPSLRMYLRCAILEWKRRGYINTMKLPRRDRCSSRKPPWLTSDLIRSHRSNLLRKERSYYERFGWDVPHDLPYRWPRNSSSVIACAASTSDFLGIGCISTSNIFAPAITPCAATWKISRIPSGEAPRAPTECDGSTHTGIRVKRCTTGT